MGKIPTINTFHLSRMFPDADSGRRYFEGRLWPNGVKCPTCQSNDRITSRKGGYYRCNPCKEDFTVRTGTIFERSHVPLHKWIYAMYLLVTARKGISSLQLSKEIGITQKSAWFVLQRLQEACGNDPTMLRGIVEVDENYIGHKESSKHKSKQLRTIRGSVAKSSIVNMLGRARSSRAIPKQIANLETVTSTYEPISSVWEGSDGVLLEAMFKFYATIPPEPILDATYNTGRFWKGSARNVVSMDIDPQYKAMIVGDNRKMEGVPSAKFGVVVYDPPHVGPQGRDKSRKRFDVDFGATVECGAEQDWNLSYLYPDFLKQAKRVLKPNGLLLAKITDMVNNHKSKWPHCDFMRMAEEAGFTICDLIVKVRKGPMVSTKWKTAHHARKRHCFWIICRNGDDCERGRT